MTDEEIADTNGITDEPDDVIAELQRLEDTGVTRVLVGTNVGQPAGTIRTFEREIFPSFS
ncbi:hypothetical protein [Saliphagus infecundisoli]|uniref:Luciferase-like monooxygenase n=1 Tax=Saliphagus infecundisoli TaxID=1849069 RepID=A0ABD5QBT7_9EURY|nr:hypothetical protein [Saliphagus infecundisoli]